MRIENEQQSAPAEPIRPHGPPSRWYGHLNELENKVESLRAATYRAGEYTLTAELQDVKRTLYRIRANL